MEMLASWPFVPLVALLVPATLALTAIARPRRADLASGAALALALLFTFGAALLGETSTKTGSKLGVRVDPATCIMLLLVAALVAVIVRFSRTYLHGDPGLDRYLRWLLLTSSAVTALVVANNLLVMVIAWTATSLALHQLLTFYADRPAALVAAHKKFLVSRLADGCLAVSLALVYLNVGSFELDQITAWVNVRPELPISMEIAAIFLVLAVASRSAQLPFHGWLMQVMEAPTPVSALLHAGVVNIGGFILIRLAPWIALAKLAQMLLIVVGLVSTLVAALIMTTRVSVKVALAWSTCAQMGFMLLQCGLGLWPLALLHLVAHSIYKAHAFLSAGSVVEDWTRETLITKRPLASPFLLVAAVFVSVGALLLGTTILLPRIGVAPSYGFADLVFVVLLGLSLVPLLAAGAAGGVQRAFAMAPRVIAIVVLYLGWHALAERLIPAHVEAPNVVGCWLTGLGFVGLFAMKTALQLAPHGRLARTLHPWLFSGLYLDELFTRLTFRVWPPRLPRPNDAAPRAIHAPTPIEVRA